MENSELKVGDIVKSVETNWVGLVVETYPNEEGEQVVVCNGIDPWSMVIRGWSYEEASCPDDKRWFTASDVTKIDTAWPER